MKTKLAALAVSIALALCASPSLALANSAHGSSGGEGAAAAAPGDGAVVLAAAETSPLETQSAVFASGTSGTCTWEISADGLLTIRPTDGVSGQLADSRQVHYEEADWDGDDDTSGSRDEDLSDAEYRYELPAGFEHDDYEGGYFVWGAFPWSGPYAWREYGGAYDGGSYGYNNGGSAGDSIVSLFQDQITAVKVEDGVKAGKNARCLFAGLDLDYLDIAGLDTSETEDMGEMFRCTEVQEGADLDLDTSKVLYMDRMFERANFHGGFKNDAWDVSNVRDTSFMYSMYGWQVDYRYWIEQLSVYGTYPSLENATGMFSGFTDAPWLCKRIDLSDLDTRNVNCDYMFEGADIGELVVGENFSFETMGNMGRTAYYDERKQDWVGTENEWYSERDGITFTDKEMIDTRSGIADTYCSPKRYDASLAAVSGIVTKTYSAKPQTQSGIVVKHDERTLVQGRDYSLSYRNNTKVGTATLVLSGKGKYHGSQSLTFRINKADNPFTVKAKTATVKAGKVKKKAQTVTAKKAFTVSKAQGKVAYKKKSGNKKIVVASNGKVTVKKGLKKGTYKVKVAITAKGNANYKAATRNVTLKVKVK